MIKNNIKEQTNTPTRVTIASPLKSFDSGASPFLNKNILSDIFDIDEYKQSIKAKLKGLELIELLEWAHYKKLKAFQRYKRNQYSLCLETLIEIIAGIDDINEFDEHYQVIYQDIKIPCVLKIVSCLIYKEEVVDALRVSEYILGIDENNEEAAHKHNLCIKLLKEKQVNESMLSARKNFKFSKKLQNQNEANSEDYETLTNCETNSFDSKNLLNYDDIWIKLEKFGLLKYLIYPFYGGYNFFKNRLNCCDRKELENDVLNVEDYFESSPNEENE